MADVEMATCPECGKECKARGLGIHRALSHRVPARNSKRAKRPARQRRGLPQGAPATVEGIKQSFATLAAHQRCQEEIIAQCLDGLDELLTNAHELRKGYIEKADRLKKLRVEVAALGLPVDGN